MYMPLAMAQVYLVALNRLSRGIDGEISNSIQAAAAGKPLHRAFVVAAHGCLMILAVPVNCDGQQACQNCSGARYAINFN